MGRADLAAGLAIMLVAAVPANAQAPASGPPAQNSPSASPPPPRATDDPLLSPIAAAPISLVSWEQAEAMLLASATELRRAEAALARAEAQVRQAAAATLPTARLTLTGALDLDNPDTAPGVPQNIDGRAPTSPVGIAALSATQRLVDLASWRLRDAAVQAKDAARWSQVDARRRVKQRLARTLVAAVAAERIAELGRVGLAQALERASLSQRTFELGRATELDVVRARQDVTAARSSLILADEQLRLSREGLALALSRGEPVGVARELSLDGLVAQLGARCRAVPQGQPRADERAAEATVESLRMRTGAARAARLPTLDVSSALTAITTDPGPGRVSAWSIVAVLSVPLWEGGLRAAQIEERAALAVEARVIADELRRGVALEMARARRSAEVAEALLREASEGRALAERLDQMTRRSFEIGRATSLELVQSAVGLRQAELTLALRQLEWMTARIDGLLTEADCDR